MDPFSLGAAAISAGGSLLGGMMGAAGQQQTNAKQMEFQNEQRYLSQLYNTAEAQKQRDWQQEMSSTAYQRAMADMRAAGLNPMLAYSQGGASTPSGAAGSIGYSGTTLGNPGALSGAGVSSAAQVGKVYADLAQTKQNTKTSEAQAELNKATETLQHATTEKAKQETVTSAEAAAKLASEKKNVDVDTMNKAVQTGILVHDVTSAAQRARLATMQTDDYQKAGDSIIGKQLITGDRAFNTLGSPSDGSDLLGRIVGNIIRQFRGNGSGDAPTTVIDMNKRKEGQ